MGVETLRQHAKDIFYAGLEAVDPVKATKQHVYLEGNILYVGEMHYDIEAYQHIYVVGGGKAGASMAKAVEDILSDRITEGIVNVKYHHIVPTSTIRLHEAGHPVPDEAGVTGTQCILRLLESSTQTDLIICLISGGGSALLPAPAEGITLQQKQDVTKLLLNCGATINEINTIRKHISAVKGGQLARIVYPSTLITLILSDVIGDPLDTIASGPTVPDSQTFNDCMSIFDKYEIADTIPKPILARIRKGMNREIPDTPKKGDPVFEKTQNLVIASNALAAYAAAQKARELRYNTMILSTFVEGETKEVAKVHTAIIKEILRSRNPLPPPACIITGGETTVMVHGKGLGGRNQEFGLVAASEIEGLENVVVLSAGTDGTDGPTDAAGAIVDGLTICQARQKKLDPLEYLKNNDSYHFLEALDALLKTGPTNTNVMDLRILLVG
jgi:glycerate 2-kinase